MVIQLVDIMDRDPRLLLPRPDDGLVDVAADDIQEERFESEGGVTDVRSLPADQAMAVIQREQPEPNAAPGARLL